MPRWTRPGVCAALPLCAAVRYVPVLPSIDHAILDGILAAKIGDPQVLWMCRQILAGGAGVLRDEYQMVYFPGDDLLAGLRPRGLPIGNLTSQFWANVYLNELDQFVKRQLRCLLICAMSMIFCSLPMTNVSCGPGRRPSIERSGLLCA